MNDTHILVECLARAYISQSIVARVINMCMVYVVVLDVPRIRIEAVTFVIGKYKLIKIKSFSKINISILSKLYLIFFRHLLLCRVTLGKSFLQFSAMKMAHAPPGHHSVMGRPSQGGLVFPEYVVYRGEQAYPEYLITYQIARPQQETGGSENVEER